MLYLRDKHKINKLQGIISITLKGNGFVRVLGNENDIEVSFENLNTALHGDLVEVFVYKKEKNKNFGKIVKVLSRAKTRFTGVLRNKNGQIFLKPDDLKMYTDILIQKESLNNAKVNQKVFVEMTSWEDAKESPVGKILKILGKPGNNNTEMQAIAIEKGFDSELPNKVEEEARKIKQAGIKETDYIGRKDFRKTLTFTIDPSDAKDFDDAISFKILPSLNKEGAGGGNLGEVYEIGIHIADVSYYVKTGSALDIEARERGTSVYLVDRTIPMLPEILSNDLCSLVPHKDRLTMSAVFVLDKNGKVKSEWFGRTVIHSQKRFTYEEAEISIKNKTALLHKELFILNTLAKKLTKERFMQGAISLDQEEVKFILDKNGVPIRVIKKERGDSNKLIEEFMLLANKKVAKFLSPVFRSIECTTCQAKRKWPIWLSFCKA